MIRRFLAGVVAGSVVIGAGWFVWGEVRAASPRGMAGVGGGGGLDFKKAHVEAQAFWAAQDYVPLDELSGPGELASELEVVLRVELRDVHQEYRRELAELIASELWAHREGVTLEEYIEHAESDPSMRWVDESNPRDEWNVRVLRAFHWGGPIPEVINGKEALRRCWTKFEDRDRIVAVGSEENVFVKSVVARREPAAECLMAVDPPRQKRFFPPGVPGSCALAFRVPRVSADEVLAREGRVRCVVVCVLVRTNRDRGANVYFKTFWDPASGLWSVDSGMGVQSESVRFLY